MMHRPAVDQLAHHHAVALAADVGGQQRLQFVFQLAMLIAMGVLIGIATAIHQVRFGGETASDEGQDRRYLATVAVVAAAVAAMTLDPGVEDAPEQEREPFVAGIDVWHTGPEIRHCPTQSHGVLPVAASADTALRPSP